MQVKEGERNWEKENKRRCGAGYRTVSPQAPQACLLSSLWVICAWKRLSPQPWKMEERIRPSGGASPTSFTSTQPLSLPHCLCIRVFIYLFIHAALSDTLAASLSTSLSLLLIQTHIIHSITTTASHTQSLWNTTCTDGRVDTENRQRIVRLVSKTHLRNISRRIHLKRRALGAAQGPSVRVWFPLLICSSSDLRSAAAAA